MLKTTESHHKHFIDIPNLFLIFFKKNRKKSVEDLLSSSQDVLNSGLNQAQALSTSFRERRRSPSPSARSINLSANTVFGSCSRSSDKSENLHSSNEVSLLLFIDFTFFSFSFELENENATQPTKIGEWFSDCEVLRFY